MIQTYGFYFITNLYFWGNVLLPYCIENIGHFDRVMAKLRCYTAQGMSKLLCIMGLVDNLDIKHVGIINKKSSIQASKSLIKYIIIYFSPAIM